MISSQRMTLLLVTILIVLLPVEAQHLAYRYKHPERDS